MMELGRTREILEPETLLQPLLEDPSEGVTTSQSAAESLPEIQANFLPPGLSPLVPVLLSEADEHVSGSG